MSPDRFPVPSVSRITLLTDFGTRDGYVGAMKGVMADILPRVLLDDISHDLPQGDIGAGAFALSRYWDRWPEGTVHLAVLDPGVGTERRALAVQADGRILVAPDNGILTPVLETAERWRAVELRDPAYLLPERSRTFHGRDVFAPAAAHLAGGVKADRMGPPVGDPVLLPAWGPVSGEEGEGSVAAVDRFGNLITDLPASALEGVDEVEIMGRRVPVVGTYGEVVEGAILALVNSDGRVEVAVRNGSAAEILGGERGTRVRLIR